MADSVGEPFAWGIVGTGTIARQFAADLAHVPDARLGGICSRDPTKAEAFRAASGAARVYPDIESLARDPAIQAIYVATPNSAHAVQALAIIAHRKAVLVEKPLAISAAEARRIQNEAAAQKIFVMEAMWTRFLPAVRAAKRLVDEGAIGRVTAIRAELAYRRMEDGSRLFSPELGGGAALDLGVYPISLALHFLGRPSAVRGSCKLSRTGVDLRTEFRLDFDGADAHLSCGFDHDGENQFVIEGTAGALRLDAPFLKAQRLVQFSPRAFALLRTIRSDRGGIYSRIVDRLPFPGRRVLHFPFPGGGLQFEAEAVMEAVRRGASGSDIMPLSDSVLTLEIIGAALAGSDASVGRET